MADISMLSTNFNIFSYATLIMVAMFIHSLMSRSDMSKLGAVLWGMILIGFAAWVTYKLQFFWLREAEKMTHSTTPSQCPVNPDDVALFESRLDFLIWLLPFVTASLGTNVLSDALLRGYTYQGKWFGIRFLQYLVSLVTGSRSWTRGGRSSDQMEFQTEIARFMLQECLSKLPQFTKPDDENRIINMMDGSIVAPYLPTNAAYAFGCKLTVTWASGGTPVDVDARNYIRVQRHLAQNLGYDTTEFEEDSKKLLREIIGLS